jgi:hypothetical protein
VGIGAFLAVGRYEFRPLDEQFFERYDRWTGHRETYSSFYDETTYCGKALLGREQLGSLAGTGADQRALELGEARPEW